MASLLEAYKNRLNVSESIYKRGHEGEAMSSQRKIVIAQCLKNTNSYLNEAFDNSVGTQRSDMGQFKKFCLNLVTVALPNLIANDLVIVQPMTSMTGYITYVKYTAGTNKGQTAQGDEFNSPFGLGAVDKDYTNEAVTETATASQEVLAWTPVTQGAFTVNGKAADVKIISGATTYYGTFKDAAAAKAGTLAGMTVVDAQGDTSEHAIEGGDKIAYKYDNVVIPQKDLPILNAKMESIALIAHARRIAVYYSQIAAFQAKTDYGFDLGDQLAEKAVGQLSYEIDTEVTQLLIDNASAATTTINDLTWSKTLPIGVSKRDHYAGFAEIIELGKQEVYNRTKRFVPNYMLCSSDIIPVLTFIDDFKAAPTSNINGPYFAGTLGGLKVFVTPNIESGKFVLGVNGNDLMTSAAVYAPYMPVVPTQALQYADGATSQGFSTLYDLKMLNAELLVSGTVTA